MRKVPDVFQAAGLQPTPFTDGTGPLSSPNAFIQHVFPMLAPHVQAMVDAAVQAVKTQALQGVPYTVAKPMPEVRGNNYTAFLAHMDNRPMIVFRRNDSDEYFVAPLEGYVNPLDFFSLPGVPRRLKRAQAPLGIGTPSGGQAPVAVETPPQQQPPASQQQQQPMNLFEYMSKLSPNERMLYTLLIYILLSDAISRVFRRDRSGGQSPPVAWQTPWMPGPPRGSHWMIWG